MAAPRFFWCPLVAFLAACGPIEEGADAPCHGCGFEADVQGNVLLQLKAGRLRQPGPSSQASCIRYSFTFPLTSNRKAFDSFTLRLYSLDTLATASRPTVSWPMGTKVWSDSYANAASGDYGGAIGAGFDQYAIYYQGFPLLPLAEREDTAELNATVSGFFANAAYISLQLVYRSGKEGVSMVEYFASSFEASESLGVLAKPNPFIAGNLTVLTYKDQAKCSADAANGESSLTSFAPASLLQATTRGRQNKPSSASAGCKDANTQVYRLSADLTAAVLGDSAPGVCSNTYLVSLADGLVAKHPDLNLGRFMDVFNFSWGFIRMKVPFVFNNSGEEIYKGAYSADNLGGYDVNYWSVSANVFSRDIDPNMPYTVNALMMRQEGMLTSEGDSYVLFAPMEFVPNMTALNLTTPPKVYLPKLGVSAYVLAAPSFAFVFRYKLPSAHWTGSPGNVPCAASLVSLNSSAANCTTLGVWAPQITRLGEGDGVVVESLGQLASIVS